MRRRHCYAAMAVCVLLLAGCTRSGTPIGVKLRKTTRFESEWKRYLRLPPFKSMAIAGDLGGVYVSGFAYSYPTQQMAIDGALEYCEERRADRRIEDVCRTYATGNTRAADAPGGEPAAASRAAKTGR